jgi:MOSC domain-containing protein
VSPVVVSELNIYPCKSMRGVSLTDMPLIDSGPQWDRRWMLVDNDGGFISQREEARLCLVDVRLDPGCLRLSAPGQRSLSLVITEQGASLEVTVWDDQVQAVDCGDEPARWFSSFLQRDCRLVMMPQSSRRQVDRDYSREGDTVSFADGFPLLLIGEASLADLNARLSVPITMAHFRPNIVIRGCEAFAEDRWQAVSIGGIHFDLVKPCSRCVIPSINPRTAEKQAEVVRTLASYRRSAGSVYFGQNMIHRGRGLVKQGDRLEVLA